MAIERLEDRIDGIQEQIAAQHWPIAAKESVAIIELAFRELYQRSLGMLSGQARRRVFEAETEIGGGNKTVDDFTMGQLVALYRQSKFLDAWAESTGSNLRGLRVINLDELVRLRNALVHEEHVANRSEAELLFGCLQSILETFGILTLETPSGLIQPTPPPPDVTANTRPRPAAPPSATRRRSAYRPNALGEADRLRIQAESTRAFDLELLQLATADRTKPGLVALDIGCASGAVTADRFTTENGFDAVLAADRDEESIATARAQHGTAGHIEFLHTDAEHLDFPSVLREWLGHRGSDGFDLAFSALTLHHLANPIRLLRTMRYSLVPGGTVVIRGADDGTKIAYPDHDGRVNRIVDLTLRQPQVSDRLHGRRLYYWLYRAGFRDIELRFSVKSTAGKSIPERNHMFQESFGYRINYFDNVDLDEHADRREERKRERDELVQHCDELELEFEDDGFCYWELEVGAVATAS